MAVINIEQSSLIKKTLWTLIMHNLKNCERPQINKTLL